MRKATLTRRGFLKGTAMGAASLALAACAAPTAAPASGEDTAAEMAPVDIDVWTGWTEGAADKIEQILDGYNQSQSAVRAHHVVVAGGMTQKLLAGIAANEGPTTAVVFGAAIAYQLAANEALLALDELGNPDQVQTLRDWMHPAIWDLGTYQGSFYYASMWNQSMGTFVNLDLAEAAGVDPDSPPETLEELVDVWEQMTTYDADGNIDVLGGDFNWNAMIMGRFQGQFVQDEATVTANHPNNVKALEWNTSVWERFGVEKMQAYQASLQGASGRSRGLAPFLAGVRATETTGPWRFNSMRDYANEDFRFTVWPFPKPTGYETRGMYTYGDGWIVPVTAPEPEAAWEIISVMTGATGDRDTYTSLFITWLCVNNPVSEGMKDHPLFRDEVIGACPGFTDIFMDDLYNSDYYLYPPKVPTSSSYNSLLGAEWQKAYLGEKSPQEALDFVQEEAQKELDLWLDQSS